MKQFASITLLATVLLPVLATRILAQPVTELQRAYDGKIGWNEMSGRLSFAASGRIDFKRDKEMSGIWTVPAEVTEIVIGANVRVTGQFNFYNDCTIRGEDEKTSVIYGTDTPGLLRSKKMDGGGRCIPYSAILGKGEISLHVRNLTTLNPVGFMWTGLGGAMLHLEHVRGIDDRRGSQNHSDGISAGAGSTVRNCYLETGDDAIKVYNDILVENTTIKMIENCVPIQLGWGSYAEPAKGIFRNLTIVGNKGRGRIPPVISGRSGAYRRTVEIDGLELTNPNAALVSLYENGMELDLSITNANISVKQFWAMDKGTCRSVINGSKEQLSHYRSGGTQ